MMASSLLLMLTTMLAAKGSFGFQWTSSSLQPGAVVSVCEGQTVDLMWGYTEEASEHDNDIEWNYRQQDGPAETLLATVFRGRFLAEAKIHQHLKYMAPSGLRLTDVTFKDSGVYVITVNVIVNGCIKSHSRNVTLKVVDRFEVANNALNVSVHPEVVFDKVSGDWHAQLSCGTFISLGTPPVSVVFKTPANETLNSTSFKDGHFTVSLPIPLTPGDYSCQIANPQDTCLTDDSLFRTPTTSRISDCSVQWLDVVSAMRNQIVELQSQNQNLTAELKASRQETQDAIHRSPPPSSTPSPSTPRKTPPPTTPPPPATPTPTTPKPTAKDCKDVLLYNTVSGVRTLTLPNANTVNVFCDQQTDGGGWTVIQKRQDGSVNFTRHYDEFVAGFGDPSGEFWLGLENMRLLTGQGTYQLRVDMEDWENNSTYALYDSFSLGDAHTGGGYVLKLGSMVTGPLHSEHMAYNSGAPFSAQGHDVSGFNCVATRDVTGWWFKNCTYVNPNGVYVRGYEASKLQHISEGSVNWRTFRSGYSLKRIEMKVRKRG